MAHPQIVGYNRCQYQNNILFMDPSKIKEGLLDKYGKIHDGIMPRLREINLKALQIAYTILRPHFVAGPDDRLGFARFYCQRLLDGKPLILTNGGIQPFQPIYRRDLAKAFILALDNNQAVNQAYNIAQQKDYPLIDWVRLVAQYLGVEPKLVNVPDKVLQTADFKYAELFTDNTVTVDISKAQSQLGFQPTPLQTWTEITCNWYLETEYEDDAPGYADRDKEVELARHHNTNQH